MGYIREPKKPGQRWQAEVRLKGHPTLTATFDRKTDAKAWISKVEADIRCGRHHLYSDGKRLERSLPSSFLPYKIFCLSRL